MSRVRTHWEDCWKIHDDCREARDERMERDLADAREEIARLRGALERVQEIAEISGRSPFALAVIRKALGREETR